jgi:hypothetical protein
MAGTPETRDPRQGFDGPPDERTKKIDVIGGANIIFPELEELFRIRRRVVPVGESNWEAAEKQKLVDFRSRLRERIVVPIWGELPRLEASSLEEQSGTTGIKIEGKEVGSNDAILKGSADLDIQGSVLIGDNGVLNLAVRPKVQNSLLAGESVLFGLNTNTSMFNEDKLRLVREMCTASTRGEQAQIKELLARIDPHITSYERMAYIARDEQDRMRYQEMFGELADTASVVDTRYVDILRGLESTGVSVDNSVIIGTTGKILGGEITNSILVSDRANLDGAHVKLKNTYLVTVHPGHGISTLYVKDGVVGSPDAAKAAVEAVKDLPPSPLLNM